MGLAVKSLPAGDVGNLGSIPESGGNLGSIPESGGSPGGEAGSPLQYSCLENLMDRGAWRVTVHGVAESDTTEQQSNSVIQRTLVVISVFHGSSTMSDSLRPHELQHARLPCLSPTPGACSNSGPSSQ